MIEGVKKIPLVRHVDDRGWVEEILRSDDELILPAIMTPDGLMVDRYEFVDVLERGDRVVVRTRPVWRPMPKMEWTEHAMHALVTTHPSRPPACVERTLFLEDPWLSRLRNVQPPQQS